MVEVSAEIDGHVAYPREVVVDGAGSGGCMATTGLNIWAAIRAIPDLPRVSDRQRNSLGVAGQAADVADVLGADYPSPFSSGHLQRSCPKSLTTLGSSRPLPTALLLILIQT